MRLRQLSFKIHPQREREGVVFELPKLDQSFSIFADEGDVFKTSVVQGYEHSGQYGDPERVPQRTVFRTLNSTYELVPIPPPAGHLLQG